MDPPITQALLFAIPPPTRGHVVVNERVVIRTQHGIRVVAVDGLPFQHYAVSDSMAEAYAMVLLVDSGYANQNDIARGFGCSTRTLRRQQTRYETGGLESLGQPRGRPVGNRPIGQIGSVRDRAILCMKAEELSNRAIGPRLGITEVAVRKRLRRLGYQPRSGQYLLFEEPATNTAAPSEASEDNSVMRGVAAKAADAVGETEVLTTSLDNDPLDRAGDRLFAALGLLDDAAPMFASAASVPRAGVLLAIPAIAQSGVLAVAGEVYGSIGPAFYGLRTTIVAFILLALMRIKRPEAVKEHSPIDLGRLLGLDRAPEVKTLRRKLTRLASMRCAERFGRELAQRRVAARGRAMGFLYLDGHVRVYHGKHTLPKAHVTQMRISLPATTDYWVNDKKGEPLFVVTAEANASMTQMLPSILKEVRGLLGPSRRATIVFDRGGWSPKLFAKLIEDGFDILTYRKGYTKKVAKKRFVLRKARLDGRLVQYLLHDQIVRLLKRKLRLRQVTRLTESGHQTPILTSCFKLRDIEVAYRMFERWRQENFFKYVKEEYAIDALADHQVEPADPDRDVPNPAWHAANTELRAARAALAKLGVSFGTAAMDNEEVHRPTMRGFKIAHGALGQEIRTARTHVADLMRKRGTIPKRVPVVKALDGRPVVKLTTERKHLTNILKMLAYQTESNLLDLLRPHYARADDEGHTLIQTALLSSAAIEPTQDELRITLAPLSSPHRSRAITALCESLNATNTEFPGTRLKLRFSVADPPA
jgi:hypothetical protein